MSVPSTPISPSQAQDLQHASIPAFVFEEMNAMIAARLSHGVARVPLVALMEAVFSRTRALAEHAHIERWQDLPAHWFSYPNVLRTYGPVGWSVEFNRPAYFESGESTIVLRAQR